ncbi:MAG: hypothetical protein JSS64_03635 [Bacteroidetes bacterium]|nr:hypothetical protein [Bacteroidota bacterium]
MTKILRLIFFLYFISSSAAFGQTKHLILTREQNVNWFDSIKSLTLDKQLSAIKQRLLSDANVFVKRSYPDRIKVIDQIGDRVYGDGKPFIIIGGYPMIIDNKTETKKIIGLTELLDTVRIKKISVLRPNDPAMTSLYGNPSQSGIIVMTLTRKKYLKYFRKLKLKPNY